MIFYNEPNDIEVSITREEAIDRQKAAAAQKGCVYEDDAEALHDFIRIHWAWWDENEQI